MDPFTHLLFGRCLFGLDTRGRLGRGAAGALLLGSILPDIDTALVFKRMDIYLLYHEAGTHSLAGSILEAGLLAGGIRLLRRDSRFLLLWVASWVAVIGHIFWDLADTSDIRLFAPWSPARSGWHLLGMVEPVVLLLLLLAALLAWIRPRKRRVWSYGTLLLLGGVLVGKSVTQQAAEALYLREMKSRREAIETYRLEARPNSLFEWTFFDRSRRRLRAWRVDARQKEMRLLHQRPLQREDEAMVASRRLPVVRNFLSLAALPFAWTEHQGDHRIVFWSDIQFCNARNCTVSFGAAFDDGLAPLYQIVQIGGFRQTLPERRR